jgi:hypothetical protein
MTKETSGYGGLFGNVRIYTFLSPTGRCDRPERQPFPEGQ